LLAVPDVPAMERLKLSLYPFNQNEGEFGQAFDGKLWCRLVERDNQKTLEVLRLKSLNDDLAQFELVRTYRPTLVQTIFGTLGWSAFRMSGGFLYMTSPYENHVIVLDVNGPGPVRLVGHFAAPGLDYCEPLPDGRAIAAGDKLWLLGPPPRR